MSLKLGTLRVALIIMLNIMKKLDMFNMRRGLIMLMNIILSLVKLKERPWFLMRTHNTKLDTETLSNMSHIKFKSQFKKQDKKQDTIQFKTKKLERRRFSSQFQSERRRLRFTPKLLNTQNKLRPELIPKKYNTWNGSKFQGREMRFITHNMKSILIHLM